MESLCYSSIEIEDLPERYLTQREVEIQRRRVEGIPMNMGYEELQELLDPFYRSYMYKDGRMFYVVCPSHAPDQWRLRGDQNRNGYWCPAL